MRKSSSSGRKSQKFKSSFQFKTVSFGDGTQPEQVVSPPPRAEPMPFIITQNGKTPSEDSSLIKRTVMQDFVSREKNQVAHHSVVRRSRAAHNKQRHKELQPIRPRDKDNQDHSMDSVSESQSSGRASPLNGAESLGGYTLIENGTLISFDNGSDPEDANVQDIESNQPSLLGPLGAGRVDPFETYPARYKNNLVTSQLLDHFVEIIAPALIPLPFTNTQSPLKVIWARSTLSSEIMFLGILLVAASHLEVLRGEVTGAEVCYYETELAGTINSRLNDPIQAISDSTITAVTCLAACEAIRGNLQQLEIHMNGVQKMVEMRGDLTKLGMRGLLQMTISWVDLTFAATRGTVPLFPHVKCTNSISKEIFASMKTKFAVSGVRPDGEMAFRTPQNFPQIFMNVQLLSLMLGAARETRGADYGSVFYFCNMRFYLEHRLLGFPKEERRTSEQFVRELTRLASLIYLHRVLREFHQSTGVLKSLKLQLMAVFEEAENARALQNAEDELAETLLWILMCAGTVWLDQNDKAWFSRRVAAQAAYLKLRAWKEAEDILVRYLWIRGICVEKTESLWHEVEMIGAAAAWMEGFGL